MYAYMYMNMCPFWDPQKTSKKTKNFWWLIKELWIHESLVDLLKKQLAHSAWEGRSDMLRFARDRQLCAVLSNGPFLLKLLLQHLDESRLSSGGFPRQL